MTWNEYKLKMRAAYDEYLKNQRVIMKEYCDSNNNHKIGDIITDHIGKLKIENINYYYSENSPECVFYGTELKKDFTPMKKQTNRPIYQKNIITNE